MEDVMRMSPQVPGFVSTLAVLLAGTALAMTAPQACRAAEAPAASGGSIEADGTVDVPGFRLPPSMYLSPEAARKLPRHPTDPEAPMLDLLAKGQAGAARAHIHDFMGPQIDKLKAAYHVASRDAELAGLPAVYMTPAAGVPAANAHKIMLNLPGGGFVMGTAAGTGMVESIPLVARSGVEVVSVTYRQAPEFEYPAASDDIVRVYRELLKTHKPEDIAIFGCSAGGLLTAESIARFVKEGLPLPAAIGIFCASADARWGGDSRAFSRPFQALPTRNDARRYFRPEDVNDPLASPILSPQTLKQFPPTLIITATRAMEMSAAVNTHRELVKAGVEADLHMWDGLGHAFFYDASLPEAQEAFDVMAGFFRKHLKLAAP
jgi:acetyl esterase/lipase